MSSAVLSKFFQDSGLELDLDTLDPTVSLQELGIDSMALVQLMYVLEDECGATIGTAEMLEVNSLAALREMIELKVAAVPAVVTAL